MWRASCNTNFKNNSLIRRLVFEFLFSTFLAYTTAFIWNCISYFFMTPFRKDDIFFLLPTIERWIIWNSLFFFIFLSYAKYIAKPLIYKGRRRYCINALLERSGVIPIMDTSIITQFFVFFSPYGFFIYLIIPLHYFILWIRDKYQL